LIALSAARLAGQEKETKTALFYQYLAGPVSGTALKPSERFSDMQADLDRGCKATMRLWAT
jgi:hypothetical protein